MLASDVHPDQVLWVENSSAQMSLLSSTTSTLRASRNRLEVPKRYFELARLVSSHRNPQRWALLYSVLWRILHGERHLLSLQTDDEILRLTHFRQEIARDVHHMHAFVRFRRILRDGDEWFVAFYRPDHRILRLAAPFFRERFSVMRWAILTPDESAYWDGSELHYDRGVDATQAPRGDELESLWATYYQTTFNPARMNLELMRQELPTRFWSNLPEIQNLHTLVADAPQRIEIMQAQQNTQMLAVVPPVSDILQLHEAARRCTACPLHCGATQTVVGEGPSSARVVLVGEQPGDVEDISGRPFVGPAGDVLDRALEEAGFDRADLYLTNAVKHFKFRREGKRRIHQTPRLSEIIACKPWLVAELENVRPEVLVLLGATAAKAVLGASKRVTEQAGRAIQTRFAPHTIVSVHPSFVLRSKDPASSQAAFSRLVVDLRSAKRHLDESAAVRG